MFLLLGDDAIDRLAFGSGPGEEDKRLRQASERQRMGAAAWRGSCGSVRGEE